MLFEQLGNLGFERGKDVTSITVGILMVLRAYKDRKMWMGSQGDDCRPFFKRAREGLVRLLGEDHTKSVEATYSLLVQTTTGDERIGELRALWERLKVSLPDEAVTYDIANQLGC